MLKIAALAAVLIAGSANATTFVVPADAIIFAAGLGTVPSLPGGGGSLPPELAVVAGSTLTITAFGAVTPAVGSGLNTDADGFATNPVAGSSVVTNPTGDGVGDYLGTRSFGLLGTFGGAVSHAVFNIGSSFSIVVPTGATELYFGFADGYALTGPASYYNDNGGFVTVTASATPEPGTWALMIAGVGLAGAALRRRRTTVAA
jgi:hypothetical protein